MIDFIVAHEQQILFSLNSPESSLKLSGLCAGIQVFTASFTSSPPTVLRGKLKSIFLSVPEPGYTLILVIFIKTFNAKENQQYTSERRECTRSFEAIV